MARISIKQIEAFVQVADMASFKGAAASLNTTQPNISSRIAALESQLEQKLFNRDAGSVTLTSSGASLLERARTILDATDALMADAAASKLFEDRLRLGVTEMIVYSWLGDYLAALRRDFPSVRVDLTVDMSSSISEALYENELDLAIQNGPFDRQTSGIKPLGDYRLIWVASPSLGATPKIQNLDALTRYPILTHSRKTLPYRQVENHVAGIRDVHIVPSSNLAACLRMTLEGLGIACLPFAMVQNELSQKQLIQLCYPWVPESLAFFARFHSDRATHFLKDAVTLAQDASYRFQHAQ